MSNSDSTMDKPIPLSNVDTKVKTESGPRVVDTSELWREIVSRLWNDAADLVQRDDIHARDALKKASARKDFEDWLVSQIDWREALSISAAGDQSVATPKADEGFDGSPEQVLLQVRVNAERLQGQPLELANFFRGPVASTLRRLETEGIGSREMRVDMVVQPLIWLAENGTDLFIDDGLCRFAAGVWAYLDSEKTERGEGFFATQFSLAQWVQRKGGKGGRELVLWYYHRLLREGPLATGSSILKVASNNLAAQVASDMQVRLERYQDAETAKAAHRVLNRLQMLSTVARLADVSPVDEQAARLATEFWQATGHPRTDGLQAQRAAQALMGMANVLSAWNEVNWRAVGASEDAGLEWQSFGDDWQATVSTQAALARMAFNDENDYDEIGAAFFNVGAALGRFDGGQKTALLRVAVNAIGLRWALERAKDMDQAMTDYHGLDCAVNLLGALTEVVNVAGRSGEHIEALVATLFAWGAHADSTEALVDFQRIKGSLRELRVDVTKLPAADSTPSAALSALLGLLATLLPVLAAPTSTKPGDPQALAPVAAELSRLFGDALGEKAYRGYQAQLNVLLDAMAWQADDMQAAWQTLYSQWAAAGNPIVDAGFISENAWGELERRAVHPAESLADWLRESLKYLPSP
jgi:hypothetical protein